MEVIRVLIVHRDAAPRARLRRFLEAEPDIDLVGERADIVSGAPSVRAAQPHLVFLEAPSEDGHVVPQRDRVGEAFPLLIVFVSADNAHAVRAFEAGALDFLLEPFTEARFERTLARARDRLHEHHIIASSDRLLPLLQHTPKAERATPGPALPTRYEDRLVVKTGSRLIFLDIDDVDWITSEGVYVRLHVGAKSYVLRESLQNVEGRLHRGRFLRIHRSTIVNAQRIKEMIPHADGGGIVRLRGGARLKLSRSYRNQVHATLG